MDVRELLVRSKDCQADIAHVDLCPFELFCFPPFTLDNACGKMRCGFRSRWVPLALHPGWGTVGLRSWLRFWDTFRGGTWL